MAQNPMTDLSMAEQTESDIHEVLMRAKERRARLKSSAQGSEAGSYLGSVDQPTPKAAQGRRLTDITNSDFRSSLLQSTPRSG